MVRALYHFFLLFFSCLPCLRAWQPTVSFYSLDLMHDICFKFLQLPLLHKDLFSSGLRKRSGVLLYGPPGTGKVSSNIMSLVIFSNLPISLISKMKEVLS